MATPTPRKARAAGRPAKRKTGSRWSGLVTRQSNALDLEEGVFTWSDPKKIAASLKRSAEVGDAKANIEAIGRSNLNTIVGPIAFGNPGLPPFARKNIAKTPLVGGQWRLRDSGKYEIVVVDNQTAPAIPVAAKMEAIA